MVLLLIWTKPICPKLVLVIGVWVWIFSKFTLREILLVVLTKRSQLYIFSKQYQKFCKTYQYLQVDGTKYATKFLL